MPPSGKRSIFARAIAPLERALGSDYHPRHPALILAVSIALAVALSFLLYEFFRQFAQSQAHSHAAPAIAATEESAPEPPGPDLAATDPLDPPNISLDVKGGTLDDLAQALARSTGVKFGSDPNPPPDLYTLSADNLPLWEVQQQLAAKNLMWSSPARVLQVRTSIQTWQTAAPTHGIGLLLSPPAAGGATNVPLTAPPIPTRTRPTAPVASASAPYSATLALSVDPRLEVLKTHPPHFEEATDDQGYSWQIRPESAADLAGLSSWDAISFPQRVILERQFSPLAPKAARLLSVRGTITVVQQIDSQAATIEDPQNHFDTPVVAGAFEFTLTHGAGGAKNGTLLIHPTGDTSAIDASLPMNILVTDNTDTDWGLTTPQPAGTDLKSIAIPASFPPLVQQARITVRFPTKLRQLTIPFEFKNVLLP